MDPVSPGRIQYVQNLPDRAPIAGLDGLTMRLRAPVEAPQDDELAPDQVVPVAIPEFLDINVGWLPGIPGPRSPRGWPRGIIGQEDICRMINCHWTMPP